MNKFVKILKFSEEFQKKEILNKMVEQADGDEDLLQLVLERETHSPTYIGHFTAIPHLVSPKIKSDHYILFLLGHKVQWGEKQMDRVSSILLLFSSDREKIKHFMSKVALVLLKKPRGEPFSGSDLEDLMNEEK
ncbi:PTS sugar transporter subunit IIA [bacterium]|nr:PTS sugar transporter subunit IIA [bacterium]